MTDPDPLEQELYYLIARFLDGSPCQNAAKTLREEINKHKLLPQRTDWLGNRHDIDIENMEQQCPISSDYLLRLCKNLCTSVNSAVPTMLNKAPKTLLGKGRHSALRTNQSVLSKRPSFVSEVFLEIRGRKLLNPLTTQCPSMTVLADARRLTTAKNLLGIAPVNLYSSYSLFRRIAGHLSAVYCVLYDHSGKYIFTGADDILVKIWSATDGRLMATLRGHASEITDLTLSPDNSMLASGSLDKTIRVWCLRTLRPVAVLIGHTSMVTSLKFCPTVLQGKSFLTSTGNDGNLCFWEYDHNTKKFESEPRRFTDRAKSGAQLLCQSFSPGGTLVATGSTDHIVRIYQVFKPSDPGADEPERIAELSAHSDRVDSIQFSNNDTRFITGSRDGTANIWSFRANRWLPITLKMTTTLENQSSQNQYSDRSHQASGSDAVKSNAKLKVNMVSWTKDDINVLTTVSDHSVKIWNSRSGQLLKVLKGHEDDVYSLECHPTDTRLLYTGGHDGRVIIWDMTSGKALKTFYNFFEGQGYGAMFDLRVSPDGLTFCATDSHGHLSIYGLGSGEAFSKVPDEQFFHTDYQPLIRDNNHHVLDEQTQLAPHLMPAPFLVNIDLRPYPPIYQRLVPGRELCPDELLIPTENRDPNQEDPNRRPNIDDMIQILQDRQGPRDRQAPPTPSSRGGMRRDGEVEGVRQGGNWGRGQNDAMSVPRKKIVVKPLNTADIERELNRISKLSDFEMTVFYKEKRREQVDANAQKVYGLRQAKERVPNGSSRTRRGVMTLNDLSQGSSSRSSRNLAPIDETELDDEEFDEVGESDSDYEQDFSGRDRNRNRNRRDNERSQARENGHGSTSGTSRGVTRSRRGNNREEPASAPTSPSSDEDSEDDSDESSEEEEDDHQSENDATQDSGVRRSKRQLSLIKAKKKKRKQEKKARRASKKPKEQSEEDEEDEDDGPVHDDEEEHDDDEDEEINGTEPSSSSTRRRTNEIQDRFRPPDWLTDTLPRRTPYLPQVGDVVMYFQQGHQLYYKAVRRQRLYKIKKHHQFQWNKKLRDQEKVRVLDVKFELLPPRLCCVKVECTDPVDPNHNDPFWIRYHDTSDVIDFLVLFQIFQTAMERDWKAGDRFRSIIEDQWWLGEIVAHEPIQPEFPDSMFQCFLVKWDNGEEERMSPWDFEPVDHTRLPSSPGSGVEITSEEREAMQYVPSQEDFDTESRDAFRTRMMAGMDSIMGLSIAEPFLVPVDLNSYPAYAKVVAYPIDLSTIRSRLENNFYRRKEGIKFDVSYIEYNADKFNEPGSIIVKQALLCTRVLLAFINDVTCDDPITIYQRLSTDRSPNKNEVGSDDSGGPGPSRKLYLSESLYTASKPSPKKTREEARRPTTRTTSDWRERCAFLIAMLNQREDSQPFRQPVDLEEFPDYTDMIETPMDLSTVSYKLTEALYERPEDFARDMQLMFSNSRNYNTNKRSRIYSMTIRLSAMFETHMRAIMLEHRNAMKRLRGRKTYGEDEDEDDDVEDIRKRNSRSNGRRSNPTPTNGHHATSSNGHRSRPARQHHESDEEDEASKTKSTRSGRVVRPTRFNDMVSMSDEDELDTRRRSNINNNNRTARDQRKRKLTETEDEEVDDLSSEETTPRVLKTRSGRTVKLLGNGSASSTASSSSASNSSSGSSPTTDDSNASPRKKAAPPASRRRPPPSKRSRNQSQRRKPKETSEEDEEDDDDDDGSDDHDEEEMLEKNGEEGEEEGESEVSDAGSEEITTEESPNDQRASRSRPSPRKRPERKDRDLTPRQSSRKKETPKNQTARSSRAARAKRTLLLEEDSEDEYDSKPKRTRTRNSDNNGKGANYPSTSQSDSSSYHLNEKDSESSSGSGGRRTRTNGRQQKSYREADDDLIEEEDDDEEEIIVTSSRGRVCKLKGSFTRAIKEAR